MSLELLGRVQRELSLTGSVIYEIVIAIAERVNRKVHILRLHHHAATLLTHMERIHGDVGRQLATLCAKRPPFGHEAPLATSQAEHLLNQATQRIHDLKQTLLTVDSQIRELKLETIHHDLLRLQQDLSLRSAALERFSVLPGSPIVGKKVAELAFPESARVVTILRGPFLVAPVEAIIIRPDDILIMIGLHQDLAQVSSWFTVSRNAKTA